MWRGGNGRIPSRETAELSRLNPWENFIVPNEVSSFPPHAFMDTSYCYSTAMATYTTMIVIIIINNNIIFIVTADDWIVAPRNRATVNVHNAYITIIVLYVCAGIWLDAKTAENLLYYVHENMLQCLTEKRFAIAQRMMVY